jgi:hypothetical protein
MVIGDILFKNADFPGADEIADRLHRLINPQALGEGPTPDMQALTAQNDNLKKLLAEAMEKMADTDRKLKDKAADLKVDEFEADTGRLAAVAKMLPMDETGLTALVKKIMAEAMNPATLPVDGLAEAQGSPQTADDNPPVMGAKKAPDGRWYVPDPSRGANKYHLVEEA